jgi:proteasome lid subunit RPN8/RPN11
MTAVHWETMREHVQSQAPLEACGLLAGRRGLVERVLPIANRAASPRRFRMDPVEQLRAFEWIESAGLNLLAIFHSHPAGPEGLSALDIEQAAYPVAQLVWSRRTEGWKARGFRIEAGRLHAVTLRVLKEH